MSKNVVTAEQVIRMMDMKDDISGDRGFAYDPVFPKTRQDVCAVRHITYSRGPYQDAFDTIYLVWMNKRGMVESREIANSRRTSDSIHIESIEADGDVIKVKYGSGGLFSGSPWDKSREENIG